MNPSRAKGSMSTASSGPAWKSANTVPDQFPAGLRVLVVDDDPTCLMILEKMLRTCLYEVTKCNRAELALQILRQKKDGFDIVISDVHMPDMDGFKLLELVGLEMDLPVIMMSADESKDVVMKGVTHGACDYLIKPVRIEALKNIWQHVIRKKKNEAKDLEQSSAEEDRQPKPAEDADYSSSANEGNWRNARKRKDEDEDADDKDDTSALKKPRVVWSVELHQQFVAAVEQLGIDKAVPKKILELMNVPGLTRENVASHLQKYRLYLRRLHGNPHQSMLNNSFMSQQEATAFGQMPSLNGHDLQTLAVAGHLPAQSLATLQAAGLSRSMPQASMPMPLDQRNLFSFENPKLRFGEGQQHMTGDKPMNFLHGVPTTMEPKQLANLHQSAQSLGNVNLRGNAPSGQSNMLLMQMAQPQLRGQILNGSAGNRVPRLPSSVGQSMMLNAMSSSVLSVNTIPDNSRGPSSYDSVPQSSSTLNYAMTHTAEIPANNYPHGRTSGVSDLATNSSFQDHVHSSKKDPGAYGPCYDIFSELNQPKTNDWELQNAALAFDPGHQRNPLPGNVDILSSVRVHQEFDSGLQYGQQNARMVQNQNMSQQFNSHLSNLVRVKTEGVSDSSAQSTFFPEHFGQEDLMSELLKQEGNGTAENEFDFDGYSLDNIPV